MNYYYELKENGTIFGKNLGRYVVMSDCSPANGGSMNFTLHDHLLKHSSRVWIENANGVSFMHYETVDPKEFFWIKIRAKSIK